MFTKNFSLSVQNLKLIPKITNNTNDKLIITTSPFIKSRLPIKTESYYTTGKRNKIKEIKSLTIKAFNSPNHRYKNFNTIFARTENKKKKIDNNIFPKICISIDRNKFSKTNKQENNNTLFSSIYKMIKSSEKKPGIKKENLFFMKEKKSEINNIHQNLMKKNKIYLLTQQHNEINKINKNEVEKNKYDCMTLTEENRASFENEYSHICKNKLKEKYLIKKEIIDLGRQLSWIKNCKKNEKDEEEEKKKKEPNYEIRKKLMNSLFTKMMKNKDPILEINHTSNYPNISVDKKLISNLWRKDMMKYCKYTLDINKQKNKRFLSDLLDVYDY